MVKLIRFLFLILVVIGYPRTGKSQHFNEYPLKLKIATYNVGHFNQGSLGGFHGSKAQTEASLIKWRRWIAQQNIDILGLNEWNRYFDTSKVYNATEELLKPFYKTILFGDENTWIYNGLATNFKLDNPQQVLLWKDYYVFITDMKVNNKTVKVISTHVPWQKESHSESLNKLIELLKTFEYFICLGDMNSFDKDQNLFKKAGFNMANGGHLGWFPTANTRTIVSGYKGKTNDNIDNIVTSSNIKIFNVKSMETGLNDFDHLPIIADIVIP